MYIAPKLAQARNMVTDQIDVEIRAATRSPSFTPLLFRALLIRRTSSRSFIQDQRSPSKPWPSRIPIRAGESGATSGCVNTFSA